MQYTQKYNSSQINSGVCMDGCGTAPLMQNSPGFHDDYQSARSRGLNHGQQRVSMYQDPYNQALEQSSITSKGMFGQGNYGNQQYGGIPGQHQYGAFGPQQYGGFPGHQQYGGFPAQQSYNGYQQFSPYNTQNMYSSMSKNAPPSSRSLNPSFQQNQRGIDSHMQPPHIQQPQMQRGVPQSFDPSTMQAPANMFGQPYGEPQEFGINPYQKKEVSETPKSSPVVLDVKDNEMAFSVDPGNYKYFSATYEGSISSPVEIMLLNVTDNKPIPMGQPITVTESTKGSPKTMATTLAVPKGTAKGQQTLRLHVAGGQEKLKIFSISLY